VAAALAAGPDDANYWLAVGLTVKSGADVDYWLPVLVNGQNSDGSWGAGALATAGAVIGLDAANAGAYASQIAAGADWLAAHQVADGSWAGDAGDAYVVQALKAALAGAGAEDLFPPSVVLTLPTPGCYPGNVTPHVLLDIAGYATDGGSAMVKDLGFRFDGHQVGTDFSWTPSPGIANTSTVAKKFDPVSGAVTYRWQPAAPGVSLVTAAGNLAHGTYKYLVTFTMPGGVSDAGAVAAITTIDADPLTVPPTPAQNQVTVTVPLGVPACTDRTIYGTDTNGTTFHLLHAMGDNSTLTWIDNTVRPLAGGAPGAGTEYPDPTPAYGGPLPVPDASHLVTIVADDWTVPTNTSIASKTITMESTPGDSFHRTGRRREIRRRSVNWRRNPQVGCQFHWSRPRCCDRLRAVQSPVLRRQVHVWPGFFDLSFPAGNANGVGGAALGEPTRSRGPGHRTGGRGLQVHGHLLR
jgi:hypothetical protein